MVTKISEGLLQEYNEFIALGKVKFNYKITAEEGYCFYDKTDEIYDEEGNLIPNELVLPNQRHYMRFIIIPPSKNVSDFVAVPIQSDFELVK